MYHYACATGCSPKIADHDQPITGRSHPKYVSFHYDAGDGYFYMFQAQMSDDVMTGTSQGRLGSANITLTRKK